MRFGSADDPGEQLQREWWRRESALDVMGGFSLIAAQWRTASNLSLDLVTRSFTARLGGTVRAGLYGTYRPDIDEFYDLLRLVGFVRYNPPARTLPTFHFRAGPLRRLRLGTGHLVNFYNTQAAWDDRTVGVETRWQRAAFDVSGFVGDVRFNNTAGARLGVSPFHRARSPRLSSVQVGFNYVTDVATHDAPLPAQIAYNVDFAFDVLTSGEVALAPFVSYARFTHYGSGLHFGADFQSDSFTDFARFRLRLALHYNTKEFIPDYFGSFYMVNNSLARILRAEAGTDAPEEVLDGITLAQAPGGNDLVTELRILIFRRFEFWYYFRRHYSSRALSEYHMRLFLYTRRLRFQLGQDRGGLRGFLTLFNDLGDRSTLVFDADYNISGAFWTYIRTRYTYERVQDGADGNPRYLVQRRFEPFIGFRLNF